MAKTYNLLEGSLHDKFFQSRAKIQFFGGGYGNGKTSAMTVKAMLKVAKDYPGCNILMSRSTYPKLNDTLRKTFLEFCPAEWIDSFPLSKNSDNTCKLVNGTTINFRYIAQRKSTEDGGSTSNLLSATYDLIVVDQIEDPEIIHKDFKDLMGRLRGSAIYRGDDPTMPRTGPRWMFISCNPTRNWVYKEIIEPYKKYVDHGIITDKLICYRNKDGSPELLPDGKVHLMMDLIEGSTYENAHNLGDDFIRGLESTYTGQMKDRFLLGQWAAYEGLVYPQHNAAIHKIPHQRLMMYLRDMIMRGEVPKWLSAYDFGMAVPSCFGLAFTDKHGNIFLLDGFYKPEVNIEWQATEMKDILHRYSASVPWILSDPDIFRRKAGDHKTIGKSVSDLFFECNRNLLFTRGNNDIANGIVKVSSYLEVRDYHQHPITKEPGAPYFYYSDRCEWFENEITSYYWDTNSSGEKTDKPVDKNDHAMDMVKYLLSHAPEPASIKAAKTSTIPSYITEWQEIERVPEYNAHRH